MQITLPSRYRFILIHQHFYAHCCISSLEPDRDNRVLGFRIQCCRYSLHKTDPPWCDATKRYYFVVIVFICHLLVFSKSLTYLFNVSLIYFLHCSSFCHVILLLGRENNFPSTRIGSWLRVLLPVIKRRKRNRSLITCILPLYMGDTQKNSLKWPEPSPYVSSSNDKRKMLVGDISYGRLSVKAQ